MVKLIPLVQDLNAWKHHFSEMAKGNRHREYVVKGTGPKSTTDSLVKITSPTASVIERARALVKGTRKRKLTTTTTTNKRNKKSKVSRKKKKQKNIKKQKHSKTIRTKVSNKKKRGVF